MIDIVQELKMAHLSGLQMIIACKKRIHTCTGLGF